MRVWKLAATAVLLACVAAAQGLSPDLQLLERIKSHMRDELSQLPNFTCLETVARFQNESKPGGPLQPLDTVRLEIAYSDRREWYGAPGARIFSSDSPFKLVDSGMIGTGAFAIILTNVFRSSLIAYRGQEELGGQIRLSHAWQGTRDLHTWRFRRGRPGRFFLGESAIARSHTPGHSRYRHSVLFTFGRG